MVIKLNFLEKHINKSTSIITSFTRLFIAMILVLGLITGFSAFKEVSREVYTCLDEKFSLVLYSTAEILTDRDDLSDKKITSIFSHYKIGDIGFSAIIDAKNINNISVEYLSQDAKFNDIHLRKAFDELNEKEELDTCLKNAYRPVGFMDLNFPTEQMDIRIDSIYYRARLCETNIKDVYIIVGAGHDQYMYKMIKIIFNAILLTLIAVPITIFLTKKAFKILAMQILSLEKSISSLDKDTSVNSVDSKLYESKNEIGHLANSIKKLAISLDKKSKIDELTQIYNRRKFNERMTEIANTLDKNIPVSILFTDIDYFKRYNDFHGHVAGDVVLKRVANIIYETIKGNENIAAFRYGGEEFTVLCVDCDKAASIQVAKDIAKNVKEVCIEHKDSPIAKQVTLSIGIATDILDNTPIDDILINADQSVYKSKETGRNKFTHFSEIEGGAEAK